MPGIASLGDTAAVGRIGLKATAWFVTATFVSLLLDLVWADVLQPGHSMNLALPEAGAATDLKTSALNFKDFIVVFPKSLFEAMAGNSVQQIVAFSLFFGFALSSLKDATGKAGDRARLYRTPAARAGGRRLCGGRPESGRTRSDRDPRQDVCEPERPTRIMKEGMMPNAATHNSCLIQDSAKTPRRHCRIRISDRSIEIFVAHNYCVAQAGSIVFEPSPPPSSCGVDLSPGLSCSGFFFSGS